jgi:methyl-accepting chemotaxis protein
LSLDQYLTAVKKFNESVSELTAKLEQLNNARAEALKASEELRRELDATDKQMEEVASAVRQQIAAVELPKKVPHSDEILVTPSIRRAG